MATSQALLIIADVGGYTRFMRLHRLSMAHAQENVGRLLEAVMDAAPRLELSGLEGDAAFLYVTEPEADEIAGSLAALTTAMHSAFHAEQARLEALNLCRCDACIQTGRLTVKVVAHVGEVTIQQIRGRATLAGVDVILVHRMLKNTVPIPEYVLMTAPLLDRCLPSFSARAVPIEQELEGLGAYRFHYVDIATIAEAAPPPPAASWVEKAWHTAVLDWRSLPYLVGIRRSRVQIDI